MMWGKSFVRRREKTSRLYGKMIREMFLLNLDKMKTAYWELVLEGYKGAFLDPRVYLFLLTPPTLDGPIPVPYSESMASKYESNIFGSYFPVISNMLFWLWFINFNVGIFNALPIWPFDGGQLYASLIENK